MASMTYDGRSFMMDGRRIWLVSASIDPARVPPVEWPDRIHAARLAGFNTVSVPILWSLVEPRPNRFDFTGHADYRRFVELAGEAGLWVMLRPGPMVGEGWDLGGLPTWLAKPGGVKIRTNEQAFLEAVSRYISALAERLRDLQVTAQGRGGPIILIEQERGWTCGHDEMAAAYLGELSRYIREAGFTVPTFNSNDLWQPSEGQVDAWRGERGLFTTIRQLGAVRPDHPRFIADFPSPRPVIVDQPMPQAPDPLVVQRRLAEAMAAGGQANIANFGGGCLSGFGAGRMAEHPAAMLGPAADATAALDESGGPTPYYGPIRRLALFASSFARVLASCDENNHAAVANPDPGPDGGGASVIFNSGQQGGVAWVFGRLDADGAMPRKAADEPVNLVLGDGLTLPVPLGRQRVAWCLLGVNLGGRATLDYSSLSVLTLSGRTLVCFGPAGSVGRVSINGTRVTVTVPGPREAHAELIEGFTLIVVDEETADSTFVGKDATYVNVHGITAAGEPVPMPGTGRAYYKVTPGAPDREGVTGGRQPLVEPITPKRPRPAPKPAPASWRFAPAAEHAAGLSPRFATIDGPADLGQLGTPRGYGWYRSVVKVAAAKKYRIIAPGCGDRLHLYVDGEPAGVLGTGPGAEPELNVSLKKGDRTLVVLADNGGRLSSGVGPIEAKGLWRHLCEAAPIKPGKPSVVAADPADPFKLGLPCMGIHRGDTTLPLRARWVLNHRRKSPLALDFGPVHHRGLLIVNDIPEALIEPGTTRSLLLDPEALARGNNTIDFAPIPHVIKGEAQAYAESVAEDVAHALRVNEIAAELTAKSDWAFAKWERPDEAAFAQATKAAMASPPGVPVWWAATFDGSGIADRPLLLSLAGMTRGQVYLNGRHVGRYAVATHEGQPTGGPAQIALPTSWLREGDNELALFDEHGGNPAKITLDADNARRRFRAAQAD